MALVSVIISIHCVSMYLKESGRRHAEGEKDQQVRSSQREQGDPEMDPEAEEDQVITERGEQTDQERDNDEAAAATPSSTEFDLGDKDRGARQVKLKSYPQDKFWYAEASISPQLV